MRNVASLSLFMMVAAVPGAASSKPTSGNFKMILRDESQSNQTRPPLLPSEKGNGSVNNSKRPKARQVPSRYLLSPSPSVSNSSVSASSPSTRRFLSPLASRNSISVSNTPASGPKQRSLSVDRRRPTPSRPLTAAPDSRVGNAGEVSAATKLLVTSTRSLSVSFQGEAFSLPVSRAKAAPSSPNQSGARKGTPEKRRSGTTPLRGKADGGGDQVENSKPTDQQRWPGRARKLDFLSSSVDFGGGERNKLIGSENATMPFRKSVTDDRVSVSVRNSEPSKVIHDDPYGNSVNNELSLPSDRTPSDTDSVSSGSTSEVQESGGASPAHNGPRGIDVSFRFWQETNCRMRRLQDPGSLLSTRAGLKNLPSQSRKPVSDTLPASAGTMLSPVRGGLRPASPNKLAPQLGSSPSRKMPSPARLRNAVVTSINGFDMPSILNFSADFRRGKVGETKVLDAQLLRLQYNRHLQWRFANAKAEAALLVQRYKAEKILWNAWITIADLRETVTKKRHRLQLLKQKLKLASILKGQVHNLEGWASLDKEHSISFLEAVEALKTSTLRVPVLEGATVDTQSLKIVIGKAVDVMQAMASSVSSFLLRAEEVNSLVIELAKVTGHERALLEQCKEFLSVLSALQANECSLRTHTLQHNCVSTA